MSMGVGVSPASDQAVPNSINSAAMPCLPLSTAPGSVPASSSGYPQEAVQHESSYEQEAASPKAEEFDTILSMLMS